MSITRQAQAAGKPIVLRPATPCGPGSDKKNNNVKRAEPVPQSVPPVEPERETPPPLIAGDPKKRKQWESASDDARFLDKALCELGYRINVTGIESYFLFADAWYERYPKSQKKQYERGMKAVQEGAALSPYSANQVYSILNTIRIYGWEHYSALASQALANGVTIRWTHLRIIAERLGKSEFERVREEVERQMVAKQMTEATLKQLIDTLAPETATARTQPLKKQVSSLIADYGKSVRRFTHWGTVIERLECEFTGETSEEIEATRNQIEMMLRYFDETVAFMEKNRPYLETLQGVVVTLDRAPEKPPTETNLRIAQCISQSVAEQKNPVEPPRQARESHRLVLSKGFNPNDPPPLASLDEFENPETDEHDEWEEEWDEDEELDDESDPVFRESGDLPDVLGFRTHHVARTPARG